MGCTQSHDATLMRPSSCTQIPTGSSALLVSATKTVPRVNSMPAASGHRDVFSIFGEHGMVLEAAEVEVAVSGSSPSYGARLCSPFSASGSIYSTATTASDTERTHVVHGPLEQFISELHIAYGAFSDKGMRKLNEDRRICTTHRHGDETVAYFGIYDGHGGAKVAEYLAKHLHTTVFDKLRTNSSDDIDMAGAIQEAFAVTDDRIFKKQMDSGSTALTVMVRGREAVIACVGDSQAVLSRNGKAESLSVIHSPDADEEKERILAAKGVVVKGRIYGLLSVSRAFGDNDFKTSRGEYKTKFKGDLVTAVPDVMELSLESDDEFLVMGSDGLFEVMDPQQVVDFVRAKIALHGEVQHACEELVSYAISIGSTDNVTAVVICFNQVPAPEEEAEGEEENSTVSLK